MHDRWIAHDAIGIMFAIAFVAVVASSGTQHPTLLPAVVFGLVTLVAPCFIMQPLFELRIAASKTSNPTQVRLRSLMNHTVFGVGLYLFGMLVSWLL
jgi:Protein of unknown function (DUF2938).